MSKRLVAIMSVGMLFATSLVLGAAALAQEERAAGTNLTPEQRERFAEGAKGVAGLSDDEISAALKDPASVEAIPVRVEETLEGPDRDGARSTAANCTSMSASRNYYNVRGEKLFHFSGRKEWCFNYSSAVTYAPRATIGHVITPTGHEAGWRYTGVAERAEKYAKFRGFPRGSHTSRFVVRFRTCKPQSGCMHVYPQYRGVGNYDGTGYQRTKTLPDAPN